MTYMRYLAQSRTGRSLFAAGAALLLTSAASGAQEAKKAEAVKKPDAGKFNLTIQGTKAGACTFKFDADGGSEATVNVEIGGQDKKFLVKVKAKGDKLQGFSSEESKENHFAVTVEGGKAKVSVNDSAADTQTLTAGTLPFGNLCPHLMNHLLAAYDAKKGGAQPFNMVLVEGIANGQLMTLKMKLTSKGSKEQKVDGKAVAVTSYSLVLDADGTDIEVKLFANADKRLLAWDVPSQSYTAVREGFEDVLKGAK